MEQGVFGNAVFPRHDIHPLIIDMEKAKFRPQASGLRVEHLSLVWRVIAHEMFVCEGWDYKSEKETGD